MRCLTILTLAAGLSATAATASRADPPPIPEFVPASVIVVPALVQGKDAAWWQARAVRARKDANVRARVIRELRARLARRLQASESSLRAYAGECLSGIVALENKAWDPTLDYGGGHGNVNEPYGVPQANPGTKMKSAGPDWRTNPRTQIRWMRGYAIDRYGSECAALAHRLANGSY